MQVTSKDFLPKRRIKSIDLYAATLPVIIKRTFFFDIFSQKITNGASYIKAHP
jgi:hypothetical protein